MKKMFYKSLAVVAVCLAAVSFSSCKDDEGPKSIPFESDLIGSYKPHAQAEDPIYGDIFITPTWKDPENIPTVDLTAIFGQPVGIDLMLMLTSSMIPMMYAGGLDHFTFNNDGSFNFGYRELLAFTDMTFSEEVFVFPNAETEQMIPSGAITYYTKDGKVYFAVKKAFLTQISKDEQMGMDLAELIEGMIKTYGLENSIVVSKDAFALPLKYSFENEILTIKVDLAMMKPFLPLLQQLAQLVPEEAEFDMGMGPSVIPARKVVGELIDGLLNQTTAFEFGIRLDKRL